MSRTLVYRTNKEFDKCAELLRNILSVQESRQDSKSSILRKVNQKKQQQSPINIRTKKANNKLSFTKSSFVKTNLNDNAEAVERRSSYSPNKSSHATIEELSKNRLSPNKCRKHVAHSPSPKQTAHQRLTSPLKNSSLINNNCRQKCPPSSLHQHIQNEEELVRSSSCGDLPSSKSYFMHKEQTRFILDQFITHLTHITTISKQIRTRNSNSINDPECYHLWNELEKSLSSALSYANHDIQLQLSLTPLRSEIIELRKELQTTNIHLHEYDLTHRNNEQYVHLQKKFDTNEIQCTQLLLHNQQLKMKSYLLQDKIHHLERNNTNLIQRLTEKDLHSITKRTEWISTDNRFLLREEILFLKEKLYHVYDDLSILFNQNQILQNSIQEQKQQLLLYKQQINDLKQSAQYLLRDLDNRSIEGKIKRFLNNIIIDQHQNGISKSSFQEIHVTPTAVNSSSFFFETPHKTEAASPIQPVTIRSHPSPNPLTNKLRPKSLFIIPNILNDSKILSKFPNNRSPIVDRTHCSSSTIDDADSTLLTSSSSISLYYPQQKCTTLYNSLPSLTVPTNIDITRENQRFYNNESSLELDQISDLTSKMFSSDDEDRPNGDINTSISSSSTMPSDAEKLMHM